MNKLIKHECSRYHCYKQAPLQYDLKCLNVMLKTKTNQQI